MDIAIVGAGLSGLTLARSLQDIANVTVYEKARGVGGRMSTRRVGGYTFDHGAQYFTARTPAFQKTLEPLLEQGLLRPWHPRYVRFKGTKRLSHDEGNQDIRYVGSPGINSLAKYLAQHVTVRLKTKVCTLTKDRQWHLLGENGQKIGQADWVLFTAPSPQTLALLPEETSFQSALACVDMAPCFALMLGFSSSIDLGFEAAHITDSDLSWIAVNNHKQGSRQAPFTLVVHASQDYSQNHLEEDLDQVKQHLCQETAKLLGLETEKADYCAVHRWRYAQNKGKVPNTVFLDEALNIGACGDWSLGGRVEGAFTAASLLSTHLKKCLSSDRRFIF